MTLVSECRLKQVVNLCALDRQQLTLNTLRNNTLVFRHISHTTKRDKITLQETCLHLHKNLNYPLKVATKVASTAFLFLD